MLTRSSLYDSYAGAFGSWWFVAPLVSRASKAGKPKNQKKIALSRVSLIKTSTAPHKYTQELPQRWEFWSQMHTESRFPAPTRCVEIRWELRLGIGVEFQHFSWFWASFLVVLLWHPRKRAVGAQFSNLDVRCHCSTRLAFMARRIEGHRGWNPRQRRLLATYRRRVGMNFDYCILY